MVPEDYDYDGGTYELLRAQAGLFTRVPLAGKTRYCSYLLFVDALVFPEVLALPGSVRAAHVGPDPANATLALSAVALVGALTVFAAGVGLAWLTTRRSRLETVSEEQAVWLVGVESLFSGIGFLTGGAAVAVALAGLAVGFAGPGTVERLAAAGIDPYVSAPGPTLATVSAGAAVLGAVLALAARRVEALAG